ncbi:MAG: hypothetical protein NDJ94_08395 [Vicinamibacteria bacterium]|nr:hypothetical protein [Vicinamibacteria bacterium]
MRRLRIMSNVLLAVVLLSGALSARAEDWVSYDAGKFGFSMLIPAGTRLVEKDWGEGWAELWGDHEGVKVYALAKLGEQATAAEIEKVGVKVTAIPTEAWKEIDSGHNANGWNWYKTVKAQKGDRVVFGGYGTGRRGSYLVVLMTTKSDFAAYEAEYKEWYESVKLR